MQMQRHDTATCSCCDSRLWFGLKSEGTGWAVFYECCDCGFEQRAGQVGMEAVADRDEARERAASMGDRF